MMSSGGPGWYSTQGSILSHLLSLIRVLSGTGTILQVHYWAVCVITLKKNYLGATHTVS